MLELVVFVLQVLYGLCALGLAIYSLHAIWLVWQMRRVAPAAAPPMPNVWPSVTVQLPIYNERHVAERLIEACATLNYPRDRLQIQVLDDSSDDTVAVVDRSVAYWRSQGCDITAVRRTNRAGYKAGALAHALPFATGDFVAVFDADFRPAPDFLRRTIPQFLTPDAAHVGFVQTRWGHLNRDYSPLTRSQALALDGHFAVEQAGRQAAGYIFGFNGSGGVWRRACIEDAQTGGWQDDTLCEDLDLSYRAQLAGWRACYVDEIVAPAEIPPQLNAYKRQQFRWAKGSIQTLRKLGGRVWRSERPAPVRGAAMIHLGSYLIHPMLLLLPAHDSAAAFAGRRAALTDCAGRLHLLWPAAALRCRADALARARLVAPLALSAAADADRHGRLFQQLAGGLARAAHARRCVSAHAQVSHRTERRRVVE
jgi:cellulose synthase/poly-beta-1,6-N-acetylglucosamine synthase-like glycosyltransferase